VTALALVASLPAAAADVIEFYNANLDNYFITADPVEAAAVDHGGAGPGWVRTGDTFGAGGNTPVCRFYGSQSPGPNSHFYTVSAAECQSLKQLQATTPITQKRWNFESLDFFSTVPAGGGCFDGMTPVFRAYNDGFARGVDSNHRITRSRDAIAAVVARGWKDEGVVMCAPPSVAEKEADVVRLLEQSTLGPTEASVREVLAIGIEPWIAQQLTMNVTRYAFRPWVETNPAVCRDDKTPPITPESNCILQNISNDPVAWEFYRQSKTAPDQLRLRMAHVWHQILVTNGGNTYGVSDSQQRMREHVFGTFEELLVNYALSPQLGMFQSWVLNLPEHDGIKPNENFARELMQLFTIGVTELNDDGTPKTDAAGQPIPAYTQADVSTLARVLTGYCFPLKPGAPLSCSGDTYFLGDMIPFNERHDQGAKSLFNGRVNLPANQGAVADVRAAIRALVDHSNTPPSISRQLIQKMVTSAPTPGYVGRVAAVFKNNGQGVRGDLAAVTRAILLDPEARGARRFETHYGRLREPVLFWTSMLRALDVATDGFWPHAVNTQSGQNLFNSATVFNYYPADGTLLGSSLPAPEFGLFSTSEFLNRANQVNSVLYNAGGGQYDPMPFVRDAIGTPSPALVAFLPDAQDPAVLVERLNRLFLHGTMRADMRQTILNAIGRIPATAALDRVRMAINLILVSVDYQVQK